MKLVLASKNPGKLAEMEDILSQLGVEVVLESAVGVDVDVEETGTTFEENALLKARAVINCPGFFMPKSLSKYGPNKEAGLFCTRRKRGKI